MTRELVRQSRAGDAFHYRWAARRCLRLLEMDSTLRLITVEGSMEPEEPGEYAIDLAEYYGKDADVESIIYRQLKHSTVRVDEDFQFSELKPTIEKFAERYKVWKLKAVGGAAPTVAFSIITNRRIAGRVKEALTAIRQGKRTNIRSKFEEATALMGDDLVSFCSVFSLIDTESDFASQRVLLGSEMSVYFAGAVENNEIDGVIALVESRALPGGTREIVREDVLQKLGITSEHQLFPAPPEFETVSQLILREQHGSLLAHVLQNPLPMIVHAPGGVGKSVVARQLVDSLPGGSWGLVFDCFAAGNYRNPSQSRHRPHEALVQMSNEMAIEGFCAPLLIRPNESTKDVFRAFIIRVRQTLDSLRSRNPSATLLIAVDAADNAEMAAADMAEKCFARLLLLEPLPEGGRLVMFCRTERIHLLEPPSTVHIFPLLPFSEAETESHLKTLFPSASREDAVEFLRLTSGNPRVQANALSSGTSSIAEMLRDLGPTGVTVETQLAAMVGKLKDARPKSFSEEIDALCVGLANLPPFIPIEVLARAAGVENAEVRSFVNDLGRPLWLADDSVQFRDEPTETWFRETFAADQKKIATYVDVLAPLAKHSTYVARSFPQLLHRAGRHGQLLQMALSDDFLPENNPIDSRDILVYRLHFAFKAALGMGRISDACRLAFRAGEEVAGDSRQLELLSKNIDLIPKLQSPHRVQELAYRRRLQSGWNGSENLYTAALLSGVARFKGEARAYLRGAKRWLQLYFESREPEMEDTMAQEEALSSEDVVELIWTYLNLFGPDAARDYLLTWTPVGFCFKVGRLFFRRLVDASLFEAVDKFLELPRIYSARALFLTLAGTDELMAVGRFPPVAGLERCLKSLARHKSLSGPETRASYEDHITPCVLSVCEAAAAQGLQRARILTVLGKYTGHHASHSLSADYSDELRKTFLRGACLRLALEGASEPVSDSFIAPIPGDGDRGRRESERNAEVREVLGTLVPWYFLRAQIICRTPGADEIDIEGIRRRSLSTLDRRYRAVDNLPFRVTAAYFSVLVVKTHASPAELLAFRKAALEHPDAKFGLSDRLTAMRVSVRLVHLSSLCEPLERSCQNLIASSTEDGPEERSREYIALCRAVLPRSLEDATAYFSHAVEAVSKFGDEVTERWRAVVAAAKHGSLAGEASSELTYRFIRCGELVGESVVREKYWDRDEVFRVAVNLHAPSAFAGLSRWRDRMVGSFDDQCYAIATEALANGLISADCAWGLTGFAACNGSGRYAALCISKEHDHDKREKLLSTAVGDLELKEAKPEESERLQEVAVEFPLLQARLERLRGKKASPDSRTAEGWKSVASSPDASLVEMHFASIDVLNPISLREGAGRWEKMTPRLELMAYWRIVLDRVPTGQEARFIEAFPEVDSIDAWYIDYILAEIRSRWLKTAAVGRIWNRFLRAIGARYAEALCQAYVFSKWKRDCRLTNEEVENLQKGIIEGLANSVAFPDASTSFGFASNMVVLVQPAEALRVLDYAILRFERHMDPEFGDGRWWNELSPPESLIDSIAGVVWSALGAPYSHFRWEAAHCICRWASLNCIEMLVALGNWVDRSAIESIVGKDLPFYALHARLYFFIALSRVSVDSPTILLPLLELLENVALSGLPHVLIQKNAADSALRLEKAVPGCYSAETVARLRAVGGSPYPVTTFSRHEKYRDTPWHGSGQIQEGLGVPLEWDFDNYWFDQLGRVFAISKEQVEELASKVAAVELNIVVDHANRRDPRLQQWNSGNFPERSTSHSHGSYPRADTFRFYYSYHSFVVVATKLLLNMPVASYPNHWNGEEEDEWVAFLSRHWITRHDGRWLADRRDPAPTLRRAWIGDGHDENWRWKLSREDFHDVVCNYGPKPGFLCVNGDWSDSDNFNIENICVQSALVNPHVAESLARSLRLREETYSFYLPEYQEEDEEFQEAPFELQGWIKPGRSGDPRLDRFDPYAKSIYFPPDTVGDIFEQLLGITCDLEKREWRKGGGEQVILNEIWSNRRIDDRDRPYRYGHRMSASPELLQNLCRLTGKDLIILVEMDRRIHHSGRSPTPEFDYLPKSHKIFLLSSNGILRDEQADYRIGG